MSIGIRKKHLMGIMYGVLAVGVVLLWLLYPAEGEVLAQPTVKEVVEQDKQPIAEEKTAESKKEEPKREAPRGPEDSFDRGIPRNSVKGFLTAATERDYERAAEYLDLRYLPRGMNESQGSQLARKFKIVLDRALWIDFGDLSTDPNGHSDDGLPSYRDVVGHIDSRGTQIDIVLQRVQRDDGVPIWKFSSATVAQIPRLYQQYGYGYLEEFFPEAFFDVRVLGMEVWMWVGLLVVAGVAVLVAFMVTAPLAVFLRHRRTPLSDQFLRLVRGPGRFLFFAILAGVLVQYINPPLWFHAVLRAKTLLTIALVWVAMWIVDFVLPRYAERLERQGSSSAGVFILPLGTAVKVVFVVIATLLWLENLGFSVTTILAGLGIGGLAVALALQRPIENLISAITLFSSQPVAVGDFCRFGDKIGTVEEIGLRGTKIRTLDHTVITVPNVEFAHMQLENFSKREKIWYHPQIRLRYGTTPDQIRYLLVEIRKLLYAHPKVLSDPARIRFEGLGPSSLNLEIFAYVGVTDYGEFLEVAEDLNLRIMDLVEKAGAGFALPSQTLYVERGKGSDEQLVHGAEAQVREWREQQALYLPNFPPEKIAELQGTLEYPPPGSPLSTARS
ncbi:MAG: mechanosensitive ion channel family protein [Nitrospirales bacterium]|nr:mechanosensitive ion channel family protein [Nitrospirales bacterium]